MKLEKEHSNATKLDGKQSRYTGIVIRPFESCDADVVRNIFAESMGEMRSPLVQDVMYQAIVYGLYLSLPAAVLSVVWFSWFLALYFIIFIFILIVLFAVLHIGFSRYIQRCLDTDLGDIEHTYFQQKMSHLWVAECNRNSNRYGSSRSRYRPRRMLWKVWGSCRKASENGCFTRIP